MASAASPAPCPGCPASRKLKVVGFVSNLEGGRPWSQVTCMPNLVQIFQEMKKFLGLLNFSPGRSDSGFPASAASPAPCPRCPATGKLKVVGFVSNLVGGRPWSQVPCMQILVQIVQEIKNFWGLRFFPGPGRQWPRRGGGWPGAPPRRPPRPRVRASENFKVLGSGPNSVCRQVGTGKGRRRSIGAVLRAGAEPRPFVPRRRPSRQRRCPGTRDVAAGPES